MRFHKIEAMAWNSSLWTTNEHSMHCLKRRQWLNPLNHMPQPYFWSKEEENDSVLTQRFFTSKGKNSGPIAKRFNPQMWNAKPHLLNVNLFPYMNEYSEPWNQTICWQMFPSYSLHVNYLFSNTCGFWFIFILLREAYSLNGSMGYDYKCTRNNGCMKTQSGNTWLTSVEV